MQLLCTSIQSITHSSTRTTNAFECQNWLQKNWMIIVGRKAGNNIFITVET